MSLDPRLEALPAPARELAEAVSLAVFVEPRLLRRARLRLVPHADAGTEADLWLSALVAASTRAGFTIEPTLRAQLRAELAKDSERLRRAWEVLEDAHADFPAILRLEEELTWLAYDDSDTTPTRIRDLLRRVLASLVAGGREGLAHWAMAALRTLPAKARGSEEAQLLRIAAHAQLGQEAGFTEELLEEDLPESARWALQHTREERTIELRLTESGLEIGDLGDASAHRIQVPKVEPLWLEVAWRSEASDGGASELQRERVLLPVDRWRRVDGARGEIEITTPEGDVHTIAPQGASRRQSAPRSFDFRAELERHGELVEREAATRTIVSLLDTNRPRRILVFGPCGVGKSALIAWLLQDGMPVAPLLHICRREVPEWCDLRAAEQSLVAQARDRLPGDVGEMSLHQALVRLIDDFGAAPVLIDGIDELYEAENREGSWTNTLPPFLHTLFETELPEGVIIIATAVADDPKEIPVPGYWEPLFLGYEDSRPHVQELVEARVRSGALPEECLEWLAPISGGNAYAVTIMEWLARLDPKAVAPFETEGPDLEPVAQGLLERLPSRQRDVAMQLMAAEEFLPTRELPDWDASIPHPFEEREGPAGNREIAAPRWMRVPEVRDDDSLDRARSALVESLAAWPLTARRHRGFAARRRLALLAAREWHSPGREGDRILGTLVDPDFLSLLVDELGHRRAGVEIAVALDAIWKSEAAANAFERIVQSWDRLRRSPGSIADQLYSSSLLDAPETLSDVELVPNPPPALHLREPIEGNPTMPLVAGQLTAPITGIEIDAHSNYMDVPTAITWGEDGRVVFFDLRSQHTKATLISLFPSPIEGMVGWPGGDRIVAWSHGPEIRMCSPRSGLVEILRAHTQSVRGALANPSGRRLISWASGRELFIWDIAERRVLRDVGQLLFSDATACVPMPDGRLLTGCEDGRVVVIDIEQGVENETVLDLGRRIRGLAISADGQTAAAWDDERGASLIALGTDPGRIAGAPDSHDAPIQKLSFLPDSRILSASLDGSVKLWDRYLTDPEDLGGHDAGVHDLAISPTGHLAATASADRTIGVWDLRRNQLRVQLSGHEDEVLGVRWTGRDTLISVSADRTVRRWRARVKPDQNWPSGRTLGRGGDPGMLVVHDVDESVTRHTPGRGVLRVDLTDGSKAQGGVTRGVRRWLKERRTHVSARKRAVVASRGSGRQWMWERPADRVPQNYPTLTCVASSRDRSWHVFGNTEGVLVAEREDAIFGRTHSDRVSAIQIGDDDTLVVSGSWDRTLRILRAPEFETAAAIEAHSDRILDVAIQPGSARIASASQDHTLRLFNADGRELAEMVGHEGPVVRCGFNARGTHLASASKDGSLRLWDGNSGAHLHTLVGHQDWVTDLHFTADDEHLVSSSLDGTLRAWRIADGACVSVFHSSRPLLQVEAGAESVCALDEEDQLWILGFVPPDPSEDESGWFRPGILRDPPGGDAPVGIVTASRLDLRARPETGGATTAVLPKGTSVTLTGEGPEGWLGVEATVRGATVRGWAVADYVSRVPDKPPPRSDTISPPRRKKASRKKVARKKTARKKVARKKASRKKVGRKKATRKKATRKKVSKKKAASRKKAASKKKKKASRKKSASKKSRSKKASSAPARKKAQRKKVRRKKAPRKRKAARRKKKR